MNLARLDIGIPKHWTVLYNRSYLNASNNDRRLAREAKQLATARSRSELEIKFGRQKLEGVLEPIAIRANSNLTRLAARAFFRNRYAYLRSLVDFGEKSPVNDEEFVRIVSRAKRVDPENARLAIPRVQRDLVRLSSELEAAGEFLTFERHWKETPGFGPVYHAAMNARGALKTELGKVGNRLTKISSTIF